MLQHSNLWDHSCALRVGRENATKPRGKLSHYMDCPVKGYLAAQLASSRIFSFALHLTVLVFYALRLRALLSCCVNSTLYKLLLLVEQPHRMELPHSTKVALHCYIYWHWVQSSLHLAKMLSKAVDYAGLSLSSFYRAAGCQKRCFSAFDFTAEHTDTKGSWRLASGLCPPACKI